CIYEDDLVTGVLISAGSNVSVYLSQLRSRVGTRRALGKKYALKKVSSDSRSYSLEYEGKTYETLSRLIPNAVVSYRRRVYKKTKWKDSDTQSSSHQGPFSFSDFILITCLLISSTCLSTLDLSMAILFPTVFILTLHGGTPSNFSKSFADGHLQLTDFGTTMLDTKENWRRKTGGTFPLKVRELLTGLNDAPYYGSRKPADLWAIGLILYSMIFGKVPYKVNADAKVYSKLITFLSEEKWPPILLIGL
ncbi:hypothetical protein M422DRAFT_260930, partial [Sphaerobolus stellatus SS14]